MLAPYPLIEMFLEAVMTGMVEQNVDTGNSHVVEF